MTEKVGGRAPAGELDAQFIADVIAEIAVARRKLPGNIHRLAAFHEESGEVARALLNHHYGKHASDVVYRECVQAAAMAVRLATEGDRDFSYIPGTVSLLPAAKPPNPSADSQQS